MEKTGMNAEDEEDGGDDAGEHDRRGRRVALEHAVGVLEHGRHDEPTQRRTDHGDDGAPSTAPIAVETLDAQQLPPRDGPTGAPNAASALRKFNAE